MSITATAFNGNELFVRICKSIKVTDIFLHPVLIAERASNNLILDRSSVHII